MSVISCEITVDARIDGYHQQKWFRQLNGTEEWRPRSWLPATSNLHRHQGQTNRCANPNNRCTYVYKGLQSSQLGYTFPIAQLMIIFSRNDACSGKYSISSSFVTHTWSSAFLILNLLVAMTCDLKKNLYNRREGTSQNIRREFIWFVYSIDPTISRLPSFNLKRQFYAWSDSSDSS